MRDTAFLPGFLLGPVVPASTLFLLAFAVAIWGLPQLQLRGDGYPGKFLIQEQLDPGDDTFFVSRGEHELSHLALFHDIGASITHAREADILIIGNSRGQLGFSEEVVLDKADTLGLRVFNLSVGHADSIHFARLLIARHDLRPRMIIANGGHFFYSNTLSEWAQEVVAMSRWEALKAFFEYKAAWELERRVHRYLPHLDYFQRWRYPWIHYRSQKTGWWRNARVPRRRYPIRPGEDPSRYTGPRAVAAEAQQEFGARGALMVSTIVPYRQVATGHLPYFYRELGIPYAIPSFTDLETADSSHLTPESARKASEDIWVQLMTYDSVRESLGAPGR